MTLSLCCARETREADANGRNIMPVARATPMEILGLNIAGYRELRGFSQRSLAKQAKWSHTKQRELERGSKQTVALDDLLVLCDLLFVTVIDLVLPGEYTHGVVNVRLGSGSIAESISVRTYVETLVGALADGQPDGRHPSQLRVKALYRQIRGEILLRHPTARLATDERRSLARAAGAWMTVTNIAAAGDPDDSMSDDELEALRLSAVNDAGEIAELDDAAERRTVVAEFSNNFPRHPSPMMTLRRRAETEAKRYGELIRELEAVERSQIVILEDQIQNGTLPSLRWDDGTEFSSELPDPDDESYRHVADCFNAVFRDQGAIDRIGDRWLAEIEQKGE